jgi:hypothetical protein
MLLKFMNDREDLKIKKNDSNIDGFWSKEFSLKYDKIKYKYECLQWRRDCKDIND